MYIKTNQSMETPLPFKISYVNKIVRCDFNSLTCHCPEIVLWVGEN